MDASNRGSVEQDPRWAAVVARDRAADGTSFCAVTTTGIYCRSSCPARPKPVNVRFYGTAAEARSGRLPGVQALPSGRGEGGDMSAVPRPVEPSDVAARVAAQDWPRVAADLDARGWALLPGLLEPQACAAAAGLYDDDLRFRSRVVMARHGFGRGEYKYFAYPVPGPVADLRTALYPRLVGVANAWNARMGVEARYPDDHMAFLERCRAAGQTRPTPLLLRYGPGDYNCLHRDLYGEHVFPLQVAVLLSQPGTDFEGGEFVLTEQRPRMQSRASVVPLGRGDAVVFAVHHRPVEGTRRAYRVNLRHGVSEVRSGRRHTLGVIFHDAA